MVFSGIHGRARRLTLAGTSFSRVRLAGGSGQFDIAMAESLSMEDDHDQRNVRAVAGGRSHGPACNSISGHRQHPGPWAGPVPASKWWGPAASAHPLSRHLAMVG